MQPYRGDIESPSSLHPDNQQQAGKGGMRMGFLGMGLNIGIGLGLTAAPTVSQKNNDEGKIGNILTSEAGGYLNLGRPGVSSALESSSGSNVQGKIPSHPVGCCLEALLSFFLQCDKDEGIYLYIYMYIYMYLRICMHINIYVHIYIHG
jgi:hypothetical protein